MCQEILFQCLIDRPRIDRTKIIIILLPIRSKERGVLRVWTIPAATLPSCQCKKTFAFYLLKHELLDSKIKKHLNTQATILRLAIILTAALWALVSIIAYGVLWPSYFHTSKK